MCNMLMGPYGPVPVNAGLIFYGSFSVLHHHSCFEYTDVCTEQSQCTKIEMSF